MLASLYIYVCVYFLLSPLLSQHTRYDLVCPDLLPQVRLSSRDIGPSSSVLIFIKVGK